ncbi:hypothetical protein ACFPVY_10915 [Flavobacterium qiangtangense]|uniref:Uncharacterized protein n=1 Tax=Flavobacterium qiangtangense TaxID=1442595 RepID=A0ABW1PPJ3_9FLAO
MKKILALCLFTTLFSCSESKEVETVTIKNKFTIELPDYLSEARDLHQDASLQYQNALREFYVVVIDEPKQEFFDIASTTSDFPADFNGYHDILKGGLEDEIAKVDITPTKDLQINGLKAKTFSLTGDIEGTPVYYEVAYLEGKERFYQIVTWTLETSKDKYKDPMQKIINSFKEIGADRSSERSKK